MHCICHRMLPPWQLQLPSFHLALAAPLALAPCPSYCYLPLQLQPAFPSNFTAILLCVVDSANVLPANLLAISPSVSLSLSHTPLADVTMHHVHCCIVCYFPKGGVAVYCGRLGLMNCEWAQYMSRNQFISL